MGNITQESMTVYWSPPIAAFDHYRISYRAAEGNGSDHPCSSPELAAANPPSIHRCQQATRSPSPRQHPSTLGQATNSWNGQRGCRDRGRDHHSQGPAQHRGAQGVTPCSVPSPGIGNSGPSSKSHLPLLLPPAHLPRLNFAYSAEKAKPAE